MLNENSDVASTIPVLFINALHQCSINSSLNFMSTFMASDRGQIQLLVWMERNLSSDSLQTDELLLLPPECRKPEVYGERGETIMIMIHGLALSQSVCCDELCEMLITESYLEITDPERSRRSLSGPTGHWWRSMISVSCPRPH